MSGAEENVPAPVTILGVTRKPGKVQLETPAAPSLPSIPIETPAVSTFAMSPVSPTSPMTAASPSKSPIRKTTVAPLTARKASLVAEDDELMMIYQEMKQKEEDLDETAIEAYFEMVDLPEDSLDRRVQAREQEEGFIDRRAPLNPFHSPLLGKYRVQPSPDKKQKKVADPALQSNPLRGRLISTIGVNSILFFIFFQSLIYNFLMTGEFYVPRSENSMIGPSGQTLNDLGGLNTDAVRAGQWVRLFWASWMHSGWLHISFNVLCQLQYMYMLEPDWGFWRTLLTFWVASMTGNFVTSVVNPCKTTVGSSGGLFGLMGAICAYCIEYWTSIPRPMCLLVFSVIVLAVSICSGLTGSTDTWAHLGGIYGGTLFGFGTITSLSSLQPKKGGIKRKYRKNAVLRWCQTHIAPKCKCGIAEWAVRIPSLAAIVVVWGVCAYYLWDNWYYTPLGSLTFQGIDYCCCCFYHEEGTPDIRNETTWTCYPCDLPYGNNRSQPFQDYCALQVDDTTPAPGRLLAESPEVHSAGIPELSDKALRILDSVDPLLQRISRKAFRSETGDNKMLSIENYSLNQ